MVSWLGRVSLHAAEKGEIDDAILERLCRFEIRWRSRGLSLEDIDYYSLPGHEDEALEILGEELGHEFLREAKLWYEYTFKHGVESACEALERLRPARAGTRDASEAGEEA